MLAKKPIRRQKQSTQNSEESNGQKSNSGNFVPQKQTTKHETSYGSGFAIFVDSVQESHVVNQSIQGNMVNTTGKVLTPKNANLSISNKGKNPTLAKNPAVKVVTVETSDSNTKTGDTSISGKGKLATTSSGKSVIRQLGFKNFEAGQKNKGLVKQTGLVVDKVGKNSKPSNRNVGPTMHGNTQVHANPTYIPVAHMHGATDMTKLPPPQPPDQFMDFASLTVMPSQSINSQSNTTQRTANVTAKPMVSNEGVFIPNPLT